MSLPVEQFFTDAVPRCQTEFRLAALIAFHSSPSNPPDLDEAHESLSPRHASLATHRPGYRPSFAAPVDEICDSFLVTQATSPSKDGLIENHLNDHVDRGPGSWAATDWARHLSQAVRA
jgi:hypothetical protein